MVRLHFHVLLVVLRASAQVLANEVNPGTQQVIERGSEQSDDGFSGIKHGDFGRGFQYDESQDSENTLMNTDLSDGSEQEPHWASVTSVVFHETAHVHDDPETSTASSEIPATTNFGSPGKTDVHDTSIQSKDIPKSQTTPDSEEIRELSETASGSSSPALRLNAFLTNEVDSSRPWDSTAKSQENTVQSVPSSSAMSSLLPTSYDGSESLQAMNPDTSHPKTTSLLDELGSPRASSIVPTESTATDLPGPIDNTPSKEEYRPNVSNMSTYDHDSYKGNDSADCKFLSFEEWKKLKQQGNHEPPEAKSGKSTSETSKENTTTAKNSTSFSAAASSDIISPTYEDQGRVYKDKFNYASVDCAATIVKTNSDAKGASAILTEVKDSYLLNKCATPNKFIVVELCQDILVSSVVLGNFELFSSMFRTVKFSVSDRFPVTKGWQELGQYEAQNIRDTQTFNIENPLIWARYLKIEILSHYGNEFYCPISLVRVHGKTMMEEFKDTDVEDKTEELTPKPTQEFLSNTSFNTTDECRVSTPYLALNEFLRDLNSSANYCDVPLSVNVSTAAPETTTKPTQESIFQNIVKRLSLLETNATLSLLYVEEQSKLLSDAFYNLEKRQVRKFENLLTHLNDTMYTQVLYLEKAVEKIKTDSRNLFQAQSFQSLNTINILRQETYSFGREISFLRKVVIADTLIILSLLAYVILTRETLTVEELTGRQKQAEVSPTAPFPVIKPFSARNNRARTRKRKH